MTWQTLSTQSAGGAASASWANQVKTDLDIIGSAWTAYTPTLTNIALGNGTMSAAYVAAGKWIVVRFSLTFGTTTTISSIAQFSLPFAAKTGPDQALAGTGTHSGSLAIINARIPSGAAGAQLVAASAAVSATVPWTWASTDSLGIVGSYEVP